MARDIIATLARLAETTYTPRNVSRENVAAAVRTMGQDIRPTRRGDYQARLIGDRGNTQSL